MDGWSWFKVLSNIRRRAMIGHANFTGLIGNPTLLAIAVVAVTVVLVLVGGLAFQEKKSSKGNASRQMVKSKSLCDVSEGLRKEELRTSTSYNALSTIEVEDRVLSPTTFREFKVLKVTKVSHNTKLIRFEIPHGKPLGLPIGRHISLRARLPASEGESTKVMRAYTPTSKPDQLGYFDLLVKSYEFGKLSPFLHSLRPGHSIEVRGPVGRFRYAPNKYLKPQSMGLVAGGTGLTPCLQVIRCVLEQQGQGKAQRTDDGVEDLEDLTCFTLLFQNRSECDILLREELDSLVSRFPGRLRVIYFLSNPTTREFGTGSVAQPSPGDRDGFGTEVRGYINADAVHAILRPERCPYVCVCGPSGFNASIKTLLVTAGHVDEPPAGAQGGAAEVQPTIYTW